MHFLKTQELAKLTLSLGKLETLILNIDARERYYEGYSGLLSCILRSAPLLKTVRVGMDDSLENSKRHIFDGVQLVNHLLNLQISSSQTIILVSRGRISPGF
ncbi:hypothetical protein SUGI_0346630 [Cryptomeria japonica]|nr:hypothetical protein SUGI_0346630 [Cryptomeria japonica]